MPNRPPLLVKIAPDLTREALAGRRGDLCRRGRPGADRVEHHDLRGRLRSARHAAREAGGLSGAPLFRLSTAVLARAFLLARGRLVLIGVGGISTGQDALTKIRAGASLVQLYTAFAYAGPALIPRLKRELAAALRAAGFAAMRGCGGQRRGTSGRIRLMEHLHGFAPLAERFDGFILDLWGVIHDGVNAFPHAVDCLDRVARRRQAHAAAVQRAAAERRGPGHDAAHGHPG